MKAHKINCVCVQCGTAYRKRADRVMMPDFCGQSCRSSYAKNKKMRTCQQCGVEFRAHNWAIKTSGGKFCSNDCSAVASIGSVRTDETKQKISEALKGRFVPKGADNPNYKGRWETGGYVWLNVDGRIVAEHRYVFEQSIGRRLESDEIVHHINHNPRDNRLENLMVMTRSEHMKAHEEGRPNVGAAGERNGASKLTNKAVEDIRASIERPSLLAAKYGVTPNLIWMVKRKKIWRHLP